MIAFDTQKGSWYDTSMFPLLQTSPWSPDSTHTIWPNLFPLLWMVLAKKESPLMVMHVDTHKRSWSWFCTCYWCIIWASQHCVHTYDTRMWSSAPCCHVCISHSGSWQCLPRTPQNCPYKGNNLHTQEHHRPCLQLKWKCDHLWYFLNEGSFFNHLIHTFLSS